MPKKLSEQKLVNYIQEFYSSHYNPKAQVPEDIEVKISAFLKEKHISDVSEEGQKLAVALRMQHNACVYSSTYKANERYLYSSGRNSIDIILFPTWGPYGYGYGCYGGWAPYHHHHHHHHHGGGSSKSDADLIILAILAVASALAAGYGMAVDLMEMSTELSNKQRVAANLATLALTGAAVVGIAMAASAVLASNPVGWGIVAVSALVIGVALLLKGVRALTNYIDAALDKDSGLASDSRFQLTKQEEADLRTNMHASSDDIEKIKGIIRGLAIQAKSVSQVGFFGSNDRYLEIIKVLSDVKKGIISDTLRHQYQLKNFGRHAPDEGMQAVLP